MVSPDLPRTDLARASGLTSILMVGHWRWDIYEEALANGFRSNGCSVIPFRIPEHFPQGCIARVQAAIKNGPDVARLNEGLYRACVERRPTAIFFHAADLILPGLLKRLRREFPGTQLLLYHNDNPFVGLRNRLKWRHYLRAIPLAHAVFVYRPNNVTDAAAHGARRVEILPPYYLTYRHMPMPHSADAERFDVIFIGHYEPDGRDTLLDYLVRNGVQVGVFGTGWDAIRGRYAWLDRKDVDAPRGAEYSRLLCASPMALAFLSTSNRDVWTRRCFEIPACRTLMLAPRSRELEQIFFADRDAVYYESAEDLLKKVRHYIEHPQERMRIAYSGWQRCVEGGHNEVGRAREVLSIIATINGAG